MRQRKSLELYPLTMCYFIKRTQKCTKLFFNHYIMKNGNQLILKKMPYSNSFSRRNPGFLVIMIDQSGSMCATSQNKCLESDEPHKLIA